MQQGKVSLNLQALRIAYFSVNWDFASTSSLPGRKTAMIFVKPLYESGVRFRLTSGRVASSRGHSSIFGIAIRFDLFSRTRFLPLLLMDFDWSSFYTSSYLIVYMSLFLIFITRQTSNGSRTGMLFYPLFRKYRPSFLASIKYLSWIESLLL